MFGFSLTKILFTLIVAFAAWQAFKVFTRLQDRRAHALARNAAANASAAASPTQTEGVEDMVKCSACGAYAARGAKSCGRGDCPFRG